MASTRPPRRSSATLIRTSMSPIIYEVLDFAAVLYDRRMRLLAQAPSLPFFMGTMSFCIEAAVEEVGGEDESGARATSSS